MWAEAEVERRRPAAQPVVGTVAEGGTVTINNYYGSISAGETSTNVATPPASVVTGQEVNGPPGSSQ